MTEKIITHDDYWDCDCDEDYIRHKDEACLNCGAYDQDTHADSRINEMIAHGIGVPEEDKKCLIG